MAMAENGVGAGEISIGEANRPSRDIVTLAGYHLYLYVERHLRKSGHLPTILFVNGALTTTSSLRWATQSLADYNILAFDFPIFGQSEAHNHLTRHLTKEEEVSILLALCGRYRPDFIVSLSWGGTSTLLALTKRPASMRRTIISSYSFGMSAAMRVLAEMLVRLIDLGHQAVASQLVRDSSSSVIPNAGHFLAIESPNVYSDVRNGIRSFPTIQSDK